jgi:hypothetical protein
LREYKVQGGIVSHLRVLWSSILDASDVTHRAGLEGAIRVVSDGAALVPLLCKAIAPKSENDASPVGAPVAFQKLGQGEFGVAYLLCGEETKEAACDGVLVAKVERMDPSRTFNATYSMWVQNLACDALDGMESVVVPRCLGVLTVRVPGYARALTCSIMERLPSGFKKFDEVDWATLGVAETESYNALMTRVVDTLHRRGIAHRDLAGNMLFDVEQGKVALLDFGLSCFSKHCMAGVTTTSEGSAGVREVFDGDHSDLYGRFSKFLTLESREKRQDARAPWTEFIDADVRTVIENGLLQSDIVRVQLAKETASSASVMLNLYRPWVVRLK